MAARRQPVGGATVSTSGGRQDQPRRTATQGTPMVASSSPVAITLGTQ